MNDNEKIVQIIPAPGWHAIYKQPDGREEPSRLVAWGLTQDGELVPLDVDHNGDTDDPRQVSNFARIEYRP